MLSLINRFRGDDRGASAIEYAMLVVFIALVLATGAQLFGQSLSTWFTNTATSIGTLNYKIPQ
jgi:pilus assembly protein Flp/PilA